MNKEQRRQYEAKRDALKQSYRRPAFEGPRESWMPPDANATVIEQRVAAEVLPFIDQGE